MNKMGFGFLRLPQFENGEVDLPLLNKMVDTFIEQGGKYFDTAYTYLDGKSEEAFKESVVNRYPRDAYEIADKLPSWKVKSKGDCKRIFAKQCKRCGVDYFDVYLIHWLNGKNYEIAEKYNEFEFVSKLKKEGRVGKTGFSYHGDADTLEKILTAHSDIDIVQLQINYLDWDKSGMDAEHCYEVACRFKKEIVVMEPVKGGTLANLPDEAEMLLKNADKNRSMAHWALQFVHSLPQVKVVLSGMNTIEQIHDNMSDMKTLTDEEFRILEEVTSIVKKNIAVACTGCSYCTKNCPKNIPIPDLFKIYNEYNRFPEEGWKIKPIYPELTQNTGKASDCISCYSCEKNCPQLIHIVDLLKKVTSSFE